MDFFSFYCFIYDNQKQIQSSLMLETIAFKA